MSRVGNYSLLALIVAVCLACWLLAAWGFRVLVGA